MNATAAMWDRLADALEYPIEAPASIQEEYVDAFDLDAGCTLDVGWHLFGDAPERGAFLSLLREDLVRTGVDERGDLPDHLPTILRLIGRLDEPAALELAAIVAPAVAGLFERLTARGSAFANVVGEVARTLDERVRPEVQS